MKVYVYLFGTNMYLQLNQLTTVTNGTIKITYLQESL